MANYIRTTTSVKMRQFMNEGKSIWKYFAELKNKQTNKIITSSGLYSRRDEACYEIAQYLRKHPEIINEYIN